MDEEFPVVAPSSDFSAPQVDSAAASATLSAPDVAVRGSGGYFRWMICALLLFATTKSYMDRNVLSSLKHTLQPILGWNDIDYGHIVASFQICYAFGMIFSGRTVDRLGTRKAFAIAMFFWSLAAMSYGVAPAISVYVGPAFAHLHDFWHFFPVAA